MGFSTTAIIVTHQSGGTIRRTLDAAAECYRAGALRCVLIDNASSDDTVAIVQREYPWVKVVLSPTNVGFANACNLASREADTRYLLFLNPDATLPNASLAKMLEFMRHHPDAGMAAPAVLSPGGDIQCAGAIHTPWTVIRAAAGLREAKGQRRPILPGGAPFQTDWLCGAVMLVRRSLFEQLGGFDPRFFLYFEETDLCLRARAAGSELWAVGEASAEHIGAASSRSGSADKIGNCIAEHYFRSRFYYMARHHGRHTAIAVELTEVVLLAGRTLLKRCLGRSDSSLRDRLRGPVFRMPERQLA